MQRENGDLISARRACYPIPRPRSYAFAADTKYWAKIAGSVSVAQVKEIAEAKMVDLNANSIEQAMQIILGSARSMGIEVK